MRRVLALILLCAVALTSAAPAYAQTVATTGTYNSTQPTILPGQPERLQIDQRGNLRVTMNGTNSGLGATVATTASDADSTANGSFWAAAHGYVYNGSSWDRQRGGTSTDSNSAIGQTTVQNMVYNSTSTFWDRLRGDTNGMQVQFAPSAKLWQYAAPTGGVVPSTGQTLAVAAGGASVINYIDTLNCGHDALGAATELVIQDGSTAIARYKLNTATTENGIAVNFQPPLKGTANTAVNYTFSGATTGGVYCNVTGHTGA